MKIVDSPQKALLQIAANCHYRAGLNLREALVMKLLLIRDIKNVNDGQVSSLRKNDYLRCQNVVQRMSSAEANKTLH
jgi:hypothetical protein